MKETFVRTEANPGAVINTDRAGLEAYKRAKKKNRELDEMKAKVQEIDQIKQDVGEIKTLLSTLIEKLNK